jgi:hypothetical protein
VRITAADAREYFQHPTQTAKGAFGPDDLHDDGLIYHAKDGVCLVFHRAWWSGVWMVHIGVKPEVWGSVTQPADDLLREFWAAESPARIIAWLDENKRAARALVRRLGFERDGGMEIPGGRIDFYGWRP